MIFRCDLKFYDCVLEYFILYEVFFDKIFVFNWIDLYFVLEWKEIWKVYNFGVFKFGKIFKRFINRENFI